MNKINYKKTFTLGFGFFAISVMWSIYNSFIPKILDNYITSAAIIGFIMTIDNYLAIFIQPIVGSCSDRINTRYGKRMPFIMVGMPLAAAFIILLANYTSLKTLIIFLVITNLCMSIFRSPVISLMPDITHKENRSMANSIINFMGGIGSVIAYFVGSLLWKANPKYPFYMSALLMILSFIILFGFVKEKRDVLEYEVSSEEEGKSKLSPSVIIAVLLSVVLWLILFLGSGYLLHMQLKYRMPLSTFIALLSFIFFYLYIGKNKAEREKLFTDLRETGSTKNIIPLLLAICSWFIAYQGVEAFFTLYGEKYLGIETSAATISFTFISLSFLVFAIPAGIVGTKFGKKKAITFGITGLIICFAVISQLHSILIIRGLFIFGGFFWAMININSYPFVIDMAPKGQVGKYTGLYYIASSVAAIVSPPLLGFVIDFIGYGCMFIYGTIFFIISLLCISRVKNINI